MSTGPARNFCFKQSSERGLSFLYTTCTRFPTYAILAAQMEALVPALPYAEIVLSILLIVGIVLQQRGATLGGAFGGDNFASTFYKRRGAEKFLFQATIVIAVLLVLAAIANFLLAGS
jgi:protein translocase SecG subunit